MNKLESLYNSVNTFDVKKVISDVLKINAVKGALIAIIQKRLYNKGETATGKKLKTDLANSIGYGGNLGFYSAKTESIKASKNQPVNRVTLNDTGEFYDSFKAEFKTDNLDVSADFRDIYDNFLETFSSEKEFQEEILDITDDEKDQLFEVMYPYIKELTLQWLAIA
jgi:hypothetical protein